MMTQIINNRNIEITPKKIYKLILFFGLLCFIGGAILGYTITSYIIYNNLSNLIYNNGILIFDDKYYRFIEVYPMIENLFNDNFSIL
jgi:hypothetical protein